MVFPVVMYRCESWTMKKAERWRIVAFELWCWRRLLWVPWTARRSNQFILKEISPGCSLEGMMLKLKLQSFGPLHWRQNLPHWTTKEVSLFLSFQSLNSTVCNFWKQRYIRPFAGNRKVGKGSVSGRPGVLWVMGLQRVGHDWATDLIWCIH